jgi:hypothetical protein
MLLFLYLCLLLCFKKKAFLFLKFMNQIIFMSVSFPTILPHFCPTGMSDGCYSRVVATGVAHFDFLITLLVMSEITVSYHAVDNG